MVITARALFMASRRLHLQIKRPPEPVGRSCSWMYVSPLVTLRHAPFYNGTFR